MEERVKLWFKRARQDLVSARACRDAGSYADAVYHAQQAVEKAIKGALLLKNVDSREHRVATLFYEEFVIEYPELEELYDIAVELEKHWLKTRYPIETAAGLFDPTTYYNRKLADKLIKKAEEFVKRLQNFLEQNFGIKLE